MSPYLGFLSDIPYFNSPKMEEKGWNGGKSPFPRNPMSLEKGLECGQPSSVETCPQGTWEHPAGENLRVWSLFSKNVGERQGHRISPEGDVVLVSELSPTVIGS